MARSGFLIISHFFGFGSLTYIDTVSDSGSLMGYGSVINLGLLTWVPRPPSCLLIERSMSDALWSRIILFFAIA